MLIVIFIYLYFITYNLCWCKYKLTARTRMCMFKSAVQRNSYTYVIVTLNYFLAIYSMLDSAMHHGLKFMKTFGSLI